MYESWSRVLSCVLLFVFALSVEALPKKKGSSTNGGATSNTGSNAAAASGGVTKATDGSSILDKTVTIK